MTIVDCNPLKCDIEDLPRTKVLRTLFEGRTVFNSGGLAD